LPNNKKVIPSSQSASWAFYDWVDGDGSNPIEKWLAGESDEVRMVLNSTLKEAKKRRNHLEWLCFKRFLKGRKYEQERLWELKFHADRREFRLIGRFDGVMRAIVFCGCYHKQSVYTPKDALDTALRRAKALSQGKAGRRERTIQDDL
jgi:hypothetical protein